MNDTRNDNKASMVLVMCALLLFVVIDVGFRLFGFGAVVGALVARARRIGARKTVLGECKAVGRRTFHAVCVATRYYYRTRLDCLPKALTTDCLLLAQGVRAELCLGVKRYPFAGHAWVEVEGERLDDSPSARYRAGVYTILQKF